MPDLDEGESLPRTKSLAAADRERDPAPCSPMSNFHGFDPQTRISGAGSLIPGLNGDNLIFEKLAIIKLLRLLPVWGIRTDFRHASNHLRSDALPRGVHRSRVAHLAATDLVFSVLDPAAHQQMRLGRPKGLRLVENERWDAASVYLHSPSCPDRPPSPSSATTVVQSTPPATHGLFESSPLRRRCVISVHGALVPCLPHSLAPRTGPGERGF